MVLRRLELTGDEVVLDAGCGTGRVTERLLEQLPNGRIVALDRSPAMAALARRRLPADRVSVVVADLAAPLPVRDGSLDAIVSTATFHWVPDHAELFGRLARALRPGGQLVAQCGGAGNLASVTRVVAAIGHGWTGSRTYATPEETVPRLAAAGFVGIRCWLNAETTTFESREALAAFLRTVVLWPHLERLPPGEHDRFVDLVVDRVPGRVLDYVRLNILARQRP
jgi:trans-aconitate 2-methyltransferase